jgi:hypothetical protein
MSFSILTIDNIHSGNSGMERDDLEPQLTNKALAKEKSGIYLGAGKQSEKARPVPNSPLINKGVSGEPIGRARRTGKSSGGKGLKVGGIS